MKSTVADLSEGGLSFTFPRDLTVGTPVELVLPVGEELFTLNGSVARSRQEEIANGERAYRIGIAFTDPTTSFEAKLAEQVVQIHELKRELSEMTGQEVSLETAAEQWVDFYAKRFADLYGH